MRRRPRGRLVAGLAVGAVIGVATPAVAHYAYFTGSVYQNRYVPANSARCIINSNGSCSGHTWTFVSANNQSYSDTVISAEVYNASNHDLRSGATGRGLVRYCRDANRHGSMLDCHDQDSSGPLHVGARNTSPGATIEIHGGY